MDALLTQAQAQLIAKAMLDLQAINAKIKVTINNQTRVFENDQGTVIVSTIRDQSERFANVTEFKAAYGV